MPVSTSSSSALSRPHPAEARWFAIHTRYKCEKYVQRLLEKRAITAYVPLQQFTRRYTRKIKIIDKPLISCYVFVRITEEEYQKVVETEHVVGFVKTGRELIAIPEAEIQILRRITLEKDLEIEINSRDFNSGDWVEIDAGTLTGLQGRVVQTAGKQQIQIDLETIGYSLRITLDASLLRKIQRTS